MDQIVTQLTTWIESLAHAVSLEFFVIVGAFLEELVAPIPSPFVMTTAAVLAQVQNYSWLQYVILILLATGAKTVSTLLVYLVSDKAEDLLVGKFGHYFGLNHAHIEKIGLLITKSNWGHVLFLLARALPIVPTFPVSVGAGIIKYPLKAYVSLTFIGVLLRNISYLMVAMFGWNFLQVIQSTLAKYPALTIILFFVAVAVMIYALRKKDVLWESFLLNFSSSKLENDSETNSQEKTKNHK